MTRRAPTRPPRQLDDQRAELIKALARNVESWDTIWRHANDWQRGYPSGHKATTAVTGDIETVNIHQTDVGMDATVWCLRWQLAVKLVLSLADQSHALDPRQPKLEDSRQAEATVKECEGCGRTVACTTADPIRSGFCTKCAMSWSRFQGRLDRVEFVKRRRAMLGADLEGVG